MTHYCKRQSNNMCMYEVLNSKGLMLWKSTYTWDRTGLEEKDKPVINV